jgi:hypothetical protein
MEYRLMSFRREEGRMTGMVEGKEGFARFPEKFTQELMCYIL